MTLLELSSKIMDLYYQDYAPADGFFTIDDFKFQVATSYSTMFDMEFQALRKQNKAEDGFSNSEMSPAWLYEEVLDIQYDKTIKRHFTKTTFPIFGFRFDGTTSALQGVHSAGDKHVVYRKIALNDRRFRQVLPTTGKILFYVNSEKEIVFWDGAIEDDKISVQYVPAIVGIENDCILSDVFADKITEEVLRIMMGARSGTIIQKADDQNRNLTEQNQQDKSLMK